MSAFVRALKNEVIRIRDQFAGMNAPSMSLQITCEGACDHGDIAITFSVGESQWGDQHVKGNNIDACLDEYFRRKGWKRDHDAILISYVPAEGSDED